MKFLSYYGMEYNPFDKDIKTKITFETEDLKLMNNRLDFLKENKGFGVFTGTSGLGKTFSIRAFTDNMNRNLFKIVYISISTLTVLEFYRALCIGLGIEPQHKKITMFKLIQERIQSLVKDKKMIPFVIIDEAQYLRTDIINDLKILLNFEMDSKNYLTLILLGQPALLDILNRNINESIRQRVSVSYNFMGISKSETFNYIHSRLELVKANPKLFNNQALEALFSSSNGSIRKLNNLIVKSLIIGSSLEKDTIDSNIILEAFNEDSLG